MGDKQTKFNVGDKVEVITGRDNGFATGHIGNVTGVYPITNEVKIDGVYYHNTNNLRIIEPLMLDELTPQPDVVNSPPHYTQSKFETIEIIEDITSGYSDGFIGHCAGTAIKYIARAPHKHESPTECLRKAAKYLEFAIARLERD